MVDNLKSPFNYCGSKQNTLEFLFSHFDKNDKVFIDLFCGGGSVGITALQYYDKVIMNDVITPLINFYKELQNTDYESIVEKLDKILITRDDKEGFIELRQAFNDNGADGPYQFYMLCCCCNSNMIRFNQSKKFNSTFGKRTFNKSLRQKLKVYSDIIYNNDNLIFTNVSFNDFQNDEKCFVYLDTPYIQTEAGYNCYWNKDLEIKLYDYII